MRRYLVHLVRGAVLADSDRDGGLVRQRYPQLYVRHSVVVLENEQSQPAFSHLEPHTQLFPATSWSS